MHRQETISTTHQMYLKAIFRLCRTHPVGRVRDLAEELDVTPGTVSAALTKLQELGLVEREHYGGALLTPSGEALARCVERRFEILRTLLVDVLGVDSQVAESDACLMEHAISPSTLSRISGLIDLLQTGEPFTLKELQAFHGNDDAEMCGECVAVGYCQASEGAAHH